MEFSPEDLLHKQGETRGKISRLVENFRKSVPQARMSVGDVQSRIQLLEDYWTLFQRNHDLLTYKHQDAIKSSDYVQKCVADSVEEAYILQKSKLLDLQRQLGERGSSSLARTPAAPSSDEPDSRSAPLPRMQLPEFHGAYVEWPAFKDLFKSIIERNNHLGEVNRLHYLKGSLHGQAADFVKDLPTTNANYDRAWTILKEHYENKRILVRSCLDRFASLPKMRESSAAEIANIQKGVVSVVNTLEGLGRPIDKTEDWFVYSVVNLLDPLTRDKWEERVAGSSDPPSFSTLKDFLIRRRQQLEASPDPASRSIPGTSRSQTRHLEARACAGKIKPEGSSRAVKINHAQQSQRAACAKCNKEHYLMQCPEYKALSPGERRGQVDRLHFCANCLGRHAIASCPSTKSCLSCGERHHSSLRDAFRDGPSLTKTAHHTSDYRNVASKVLLATAMVQVADKFGRWHLARALVDQGSEISMISEGLAQRLRLTRTASSVDIFGVGGQQLAKARGRVNLDISGNQGDDTIKVSAIVLLKLSGYTAGRTTPQRTWSHLQQLKLADPSPAEARPIEILLGADVYPAIIREGVRKGAANEPVGQLTVFGWILTGMAGPSTDSAHAQVHQAIIGDSLSSLVRRFCEQEELREAIPTLTQAETECENHYVSTHSRTPEGRYQVRLPFRTSNVITRGSRTAAWHSLRRIEQRFRRDGSFKALYHNFIKEYEDLGHMSLANTPTAGTQVHYLPHHGVLKPSSTTTKLRVVFNGSWSEPSQLSLNDCLHVGPNRLPLLAEVLLRWRRHRFVVTADITKMYRQILVHPEDRDHQRILWRDTETQHVSEFQLNTVTYGLSCAPFLAVRTLHQLADDEGSRYPIGALALRHDTYVDDILTGADTITALQETVSQLEQLCKAGGFPLQKWASNAAALHDTTLRPQQDPAAQRSQHKAVRDRPKTWTDATHPTLGLQWSPQEDCFKFTIASDRAQPATKRGVVSKAAQLFDPLGWLAPVVVRAKITIQTTWLMALGWDDPLPPALAKDWDTFCAELTVLEQVRVPRPLYNSTIRKQEELHGFADASERAYGAVVYLRTRDADDRWRVSLVTARSKVAPLQQVSLRRLELCAAHLLARLTQRTVATLHLKNTTIHLWSDSTVTLGWIQEHPSRWKTYVANRVADIQRRVPEAQWHHVAGTDNPADCASRGLSPSQLLDWELWWKGPEFLRRVDSFAPSGPTDVECLPEARGPIVQRFSSYATLLRVTAWCRRWLKKHRAALTSSSSDNSAHTDKHSPVLSVAEVCEAERGWIQLVQRSIYKAEYTLLSKGQCVPAKSSLVSLLPTLDSNGLMRVGGRLSKAPLSPDEAHPIILPPESEFTRLLVLRVHRSNMHGGVQATLGAMRQRFWVPRGRSVV